MITIQDILQARTRIAPNIRVTPLVAFQDGGFQLKLENMQRTGAFKERGALNKLLKLKKEGKVKAVVAASAGNHAQAVALHGVALGFTVTIVMPEATALTKVTATQRWGAQIKLFGATFDAATEHAKSLVGKGEAFIHAFDDEEIVGGQGSLGLEILDQLPKLATVVVPVGGGGLASGTAIAIKEQKPKCRIIGVCAEAYPHSFREFKGAKEPKKKLPEEAPPTIADGIAMKRTGEITLPLLKKYLDDMVTVSEEEMANAVLLLLESSKTLAEGAGAASVAALMTGKVRSYSENTVAVVSGGNIDVNLISRIIEKGLVKTHRLVRLNVVVPDRPGGLKALTTLLADLRANILQIHHERANSHIPLYTTGTELTLETRGDSHIREIETALKTHGYQVEIID